MIRYSLIVIAAALAVVAGWAGFRMAFPTGLDDCEALLRRSIPPDHTYLRRSYEITRSPMNGQQYLTWRHKADPSLAAPENVIAEQMASHAAAEVDRGSVVPPDTVTIMFTYSSGPPNQETGQKAVCTFVDAGQQQTRPLAPEITLLPR